MTFISSKIVDETKNGNYRTINHSNYLVQLEEAGSGTSNWASFPLMGRGVLGSDSDYFRNNTVTTSVLQVPTVKVMREIHPA